MFVVVTVICVWLAWNVKRVREREALMNIMSLRGVRQSFPAPLSNPEPHYLPLIWRLLGAQRLDKAWLFLPPDEFTDDEVADIRLHFPDASITVSEQDRHLKIPKALLMLVPPPEMPENR
jgi:hypothetical protein